MPIVEDKPLARALFSRPIGAEVPAHLYRAVARLLVLVHQARFGVARRAAQRRGWAQQPRWAGAAAAAGGLPWWAEAAASVGRTIDEEEIAGRHGRVEGGPSAGHSQGGGADGDYSAEPGGDTIHVDEAALERALADDELSDVTAEELAELEAVKPIEGQEADIVVDETGAQQEDRATER